MNRKAVALITTLLIMLLLIVSFLSMKTVAEAPQPQWSIFYTRVPTYIITGSVARAQDEGKAVVQTADGGYAIAGVWDDHGYAPHSGGVDNYTGVMIKTNSSGQVQWEKTWNTGYSGISPKSIIQTNDSGFLLSSYTKLFKLDAEGNVQWSKKLAGLYIRDLIQAADGNYVCVGSPPDYFGDGVVFKIDKNGNVVWNVTFSPDATTLSVTAVAETDDGGYAVAGSGGGLPWFAVVDSQGSLELHYTYQNKLGGFFNSIAKIRDGDYLLAGRTYRGGINNQNQGWLAKVDSNGEMQWNRTFNNPPYQDFSFLSIAQTGDGGFIAAGRSALVKTDVSGNLQWNATYVDVGLGSVNSLIATDDGGFAVVGTINDSIWLAKFAPESAVQEPISRFIVIVVMVTVVGVGLLVYFKKRKR